MWYRALCKVAEGDKYYSVGLSEWNERNPTDVGTKECDAESVEHFGAVCSSPLATGIWAAFFLGFRGASTLGYVVGRF